MENANDGVIPFGGFEDYEDKDFDSVCFVTLDVLGGCPIHAELGVIGSSFHL